VNKLAKKNYYSILINCSPGLSNMKACVSFLKLLFQKNVISWLTTWNSAYIDHYALSRSSKVDLRYICRISLSSDNLRTPEEEKLEIVQIYLFKRIIDALSEIMRQTNTSVKEINVCQVFNWKVSSALMVGDPSNELKLTRR